MIYNVLTQADIAEKDLSEVFATATGWKYNSHKVPRGYKRSNSVWLQSVYATHEAVQCSSASDVH